MFGDQVKAKGALAAKLQGLDHAGTVALVDAAERRWRRFGPGAVPIAEALAALGIAPAPTALPD